nr:MAG TPA: hypothetical protein [Caudoviricetes sp.]
MCASPLTTTEKRTRQCYKDTTTAPFYLTTKGRRWQDERSFYVRKKK